MLVQIRIRVCDFLHRYMPSSWVQSASRSWSVREWVSRRSGVTGATRRPSRTTTNCLTHGLLTEVEGSGCGCQLLAASTRSDGDNVGRERSPNSLRVCTGLDADFNSRHRRRLGRNPARIRLHRLRPLNDSDTRAVASPLDADRRRVTPAPREALLRSVPPSVFVDRSRQPAGDSARGPTRRRLLV